ncbi:MAG: hypothetical protein HQL25_00770 [Candidatus Omnitrophica bacterium]|nr:hypothetical protein [Candidatus Omnitrophota bacterium]
MAKSEIQSLLDGLTDEGNGYGDPEARRNAELRLQILIAKEQQKTSSTLNWLTFFLVVVGILQVVILVFQIWIK